MTVLGFVSTLTCVRGSKAGTFAVARGDLRLNFRGVDLIAELLSPLDVLTSLNDDALPKYSRWAGFFDERALLSARGRPSKDDCGSPAAPSEDFGSVCPLRFCLIEVASAGAGFSTLTAETSVASSSPSSALAADTLAIVTHLMIDA